MATCTAPGHPSCTITCPNGCIAVYYESSGNCRTGCSASIISELDPNEKFSIQISEVSSDELLKALSSKLAITPKSGGGKTTSITLSNVMLSDVLEKIQQLV